MPSRRTLLVGRLPILANCRLLIVFVTGNLHLFT